MEQRPGRTCPLAYRYGAASLRRAADFSADVLYVIGGLYGNPFALDALLELQAREPDAQLIFNGDFNWFNVAPADFIRINTEVLKHRAIRGNVETELLADDPAAGCGCGYPDWVDDGDVARSNAIMAQLATTARHDAQTLALAQRVSMQPMTAVAQVGTARVAIVHGDIDSLAGWDFTQECVDAGLAAAFTRADVSIIASSHTCLPVAQRFETSQGARALFNNGAAGMPNLTDLHAGIITRIARRPAPDKLLDGTTALYGTRVGDVFIDALTLDYNHAAWLAHFDAHWPSQSAAALSYRKRIDQGPSYTLAQAMRAGIEVRSIPETEMRRAA